VVLFAGTQGYLDDLQVTDIRAFEDGLYKYFRQRADGADRRPDQEEGARRRPARRLHAALKEYAATSRRSWRRQRRKSSQLSAFSSVDQSATMFAGNWAETELRINRN
jgi:hypothetical protein